MSRSNRAAAQGLGKSILEHAEERVRSVDADLDRAEALINGFCACEGAYTPRLEVLTPAEGAASPEAASAQSDDQHVREIFSALCWVFALGVVIGLGTGLLVFVASQVVIGWWS